MARQSPTCSVQDGIAERQNFRLSKVWAGIYRSVAFTRPQTCRCGEMADAQDLKSWDPKKSCGFESHHRHHFNYDQYNQWFCQCLGFGYRLGITVSHNTSCHVQECFETVFD